MHPQKENTKPYSISEFTEKAFLQPLRMAREFKQLLADVFLIPQQHQYYFYPAWMWQNHPYVNGNSSSNNNWSGIERKVDPSYLVFGYKATVCDYCCEPKLERVLYKDDTNKDMDDEISHKCNTTNELQGAKLANNSPTLGKNNIVKELQQKTALALKQLIIDNWLIKGPIYLMAAGLSNLNLAKKEFGLELDHNNKVCINCSYVKEIDIFPTEENEDYYILRAIKYNPTYITEDEIYDFLNIVGNSTFVKIHNPNSSSVKFYFIALSPIFLTFRRENYEHDNNNNKNDNDDDIETNLNVTTTTTTSNFKNEKIAKDHFLSDLDPRMVEMFADMLRNNNKK